jgi:hypothetical protein
MPNDNLISASISSEDIQAIKDALALVRDKLPFLLSLNPQERREMAKMGEKSIGFDEKCTLYMNNHSEFVPGFLDMQEVARSDSGVLEYAQRTDSTRRRYSNGCQSRRLDWAQVAP